MSEVALFFKILGSTLIIFSGSTLGFLMGNDLKKRLSQLFELKKLFLIVKSDISYGGYSMHEVFEYASKKTVDQYQKWLTYIRDETYDCSEKMFCEIWSTSIELHLGNTALSNGDKQELTMLGSSFGTIDKEQQITMIELYLHKLEHAIRELQQEIQGKMKLYKAIGLAGSSFLVIALL